MNNKPVIALLPGSRKQEVQAMLSEMMKVARAFSDYEFVIAAAPSLDKEFYEKFSIEGFKTIYGHTYDVLNIAHAAIVTSGTATLETALFKVPQVVCYRGGKISYFIAKSLVKIKFISLVNLILNRLAVSELIQHNMNAENISAELKKIVGNSSKRKRMLIEYDQLISVLGGKGASENAAKEIVQFLKY